MAGLDLQLSLEFLTSPSPQSSRRRLRLGCSCSNLTHLNLEEGEEQFKGATHLGILMLPFRALLH